ncbi:hypothetical protein GEV33_006701 [Tenebrio molitor]|uniref:Uncharacterized protein n=1 Tax=Tenebrio molitor TaxID=7067 RepID=A0A8J6HK51_TENMO|nr:hypothetical protein GEV33_006701 [Tenebrio molitor]
MAFGNPPSGMIADPERHARDSQLATCGTAARSAVADRESNTKDLDLIPLGDKASRISKGRTHKDEGRRLGRRREEDNFPASHGDKRESELTLPYGYPS